MPIQHWSRAFYSQAQKIPSAFHIAHDSLLLSTHSVIQSLSVKDFAEVQLGEEGGSDISHLVNVHLVNIDQMRIYNVKVDKVKGGN